MQTWTGNAALHRLPSQHDCFSYWFWWAWATECQNCWNFISLKLRDLFILFISVPSFTHGLYGRIHTKKNTYIWNTKIFQEKEDNAAFSFLLVLLVIAFRQQSSSVHFKEWTCTKRNLHSFTKKKNLILPDLKISLIDWRLGQCLPRFIDLFMAL